jgi:hypothetical protein
MNKKTRRKTLGEYYETICVWLILGLLLFGTIGAMYKIWM